MIFEEFVNDTNKHLKDICEFLEIDSSFKFQDPTFKNKTGLPKNKFLDNLIKNRFPFKNLIKKVLVIFFGEKNFKNNLIKIRESNLGKSILDNDRKQELYELFIDDIERLEKLINKDLSSWKI